MTFDGSIEAHDGEFMIETSKPRHRQSLKKHKTQEDSAESFSCRFFPSCAWSDGAFSLNQEVSLVVFLLCSASLETISQVDRDDEQKQRRKVMWGSLVDFPHSTKNSSNHPALNPSVLRTWTSSWLNQLRTWNSSYIMMTISLDFWRIIELEDEWWEIIERYQFIKFAYVSHFSFPFFDGKLLTEATGGSLRMMEIVINDPVGLICMHALIFLLFFSCHSLLTLNQIMLDIKAGSSFLTHSTKNYCSVASSAHTKKFNFRTTAAEHKPRCAKSFFGGFCALVMSRRVIRCH